MTLLDRYAEDLRALDSARLRRTRRCVERVHGTRLTVGGREMLAFCSND